MRILLVYCHPNPESYCAALRDEAISALKSAGHEIDLLDLYAENFDPVLSRAERETYIPNPEINAAALKRHVDALEWAEGLVVIYPTWIYGPPAMLKGWLERAWLPGRTFIIPVRKGERPGSNMRRIKFFAGVTTSGSPWWWFRLMGDPGRVLFMRGLAMLYGAGCRKFWLQLYSFNTATQQDRSVFLKKVSARFAAVR